MGFLELFLIAIGLSADAFSVSVCKGLNMRKLNLKHAYLIALFFGVFQAVMPLIGYLLGTGFSEYIEKFDHWIAFATRKGRRTGRKDRRAQHGRTDRPCGSHKH